MCEPEIVVYGVSAVECFHFCVCMFDALSDSRQKMHRDCGALCPHARGGLTALWRFRFPSQRWFNIQAGLAAFNFVWEVELTLCELRLRDRLDNFHGLQIVSKLLFTSLESKQWNWMANESFDEENPLHHMNRDQWHSGEGLHECQNAGFITKWKGTRHVPEKERQSEVLQRKKNFYCIFSNYRKKNGGHCLFVQLLSNWV